MSYQLNKSPELFEGKAALYKSIKNGKPILLAIGDTYSEIADYADTKPAGNCIYCIKPFKGEIPEGGITC